jgi:hypothetical protein
LKAIESGAARLDGIDDGIWREADPQQLVRQEEAMGIRFWSCEPV